MLLKGNLGGTIFCLIYLLQAYSCHLTHEENVLIDTLKHQVAVLIDKFEAVSKDNAELRNRVTILEQDKVNNDKLSNTRDSNRERRQLSPYVAFSAYLDHPLKGLARGAPITYNRVLTNDANAYDNATGIFVAPLTGLYLFSWATTARQLSGQQAYDEWIHLLIDGTRTLSTVAESRNVADDNQGSNTVVLRINKGQRIWTEHNSAYDTIHGSDIERTTSFTGVLLHEYE